jgi:hypothetical protein
MLLLLVKNWLDIDNLMWFNLSPYNLGQLKKLNLLIYEKYLEQHLAENRYHIICWPKMKGLISDEWMERYI